MHETVGDALRTLRELNPPTGVADAQQLVDTAMSHAVYALRAAVHGADTAISHAVHALRATAHGAFQASPVSLAFGRDMLLEIPPIAG